MNKLKSCIPAVLTAVLMLACSCAQKADPEPYVPVPPAGFEPTPENVRVIGRGQYIEDKGMLVFGLTDTGAEFAFTGTSAEILLMGDNGSSGTLNPARFRLFADGECVSDFVMEDRLQNVSYTFDTPGEHTLRLLKVSEASYGAAGIDLITVDSTGISPAGNKKHKIEFIGDSITCGYGVDASGLNEHFSTKTEDGTKTYAYKAAEKLGAEASMVCYSGYGIISGYSDNGERNAEATLPQYYDSLSFTKWSDLDTSTPLKELRWDHSLFEPDAVVINLGTNDISYMSSVSDENTVSDEREAFCIEYKAFLKQVRNAHPNAYILCTLGIMGQALCDDIERAAAEYSSETGDNNVGTLKFDYQDVDSDGVGADWHPSEKTHEKAAEKLVKALKSKL